MGQLSNWVSTQRQEYKLLKRGKRSSTLNDERIKLLNCIGFVWVAQRGSPRKQRKAGRILVPESCNNNKGLTPVFTAEARSAHKSAAICLLRAFPRNLGGGKNVHNGIESERTNSFDPMKYPSTSNSITAAAVAAKMGLNAAKEAEEEVEEEEIDDNEEEAEGGNKKPAVIEEVSQGIDISASAGDMVARNGSTALHSQFPISLLPNQGIATAAQRGIAGIAGGLPSNHLGLQNLMLGSAGDVGAGASPLWHLLPTGAYEQDRQLRSQQLALCALSGLTGAGLTRAGAGALTAPHVLQQQYLPITSQMLAAATAPTPVISNISLGLSLQQQSQLNSIQQHQQQQQELQQQQQIMNVLAAVAAVQRGGTVNSDPTRQQQSTLTSASFLPIGHSKQPERMSQS